MSLDSAIQHLLKAKRISNASQSYAKDNPSEWAKVKAYLEGGTRPSGVVTEMGLGLLEVEDVRRPTPPPSGVVYFDGGFETGNVNQWPDLHDCPPNGRAIVTHPSTAGPHSQYAWRCQTSNLISSGTGGGPSNMVEQIANAPWERPGQLTFYRYKVLFPSGNDSRYAGRFIPPASGTLNTHLAFHQMNYGKYSTHFGFNSAAGGGLGSVFWMQVGGGDVNIVHQWFWDRQADNVTPIPIQYDTWAEIVLEVYWSHLGSIGASPGYLKLWVDWGAGRRQVCPPASGKDYYGDPWPLNRPTLWRSPDGNYDPVWMTNGQYRWSAPGSQPPITQETSIYFDDFKIGSTLSAVGG